MGAVRRRKGLARMRGNSAAAGALVGERRHSLEGEMRGNSIFWLIGVAVVIVLVLSLLGLI